MWHVISMLLTTVQWFLMIGDHVFPYLYHSRKIVKYLPSIFYAILDHCLRQNLNLFWVVWFIPFIVHFIWLLKSNHLTLPSPQTRYHKWQLQIYNMLFIFAAQSPTAAPVCMPDTMDLESLWVSACHWHIASYIPSIDLEQTYVLQGSATIMKSEVVTSQVQCKYLHKVSYCSIYMCISWQQGILWNFFN